MHARIRAVTAPEDALARSFPEKVVAMRLVRTLVVTSLATVVLALAAAPAGAQCQAPTLVDVRAGRPPRLRPGGVRVPRRRARAPHRLRRPARPGRLGQPGVGGRRRRPRGRLRGRQRPRRGRLPHRQPAALLARPDRRQGGRPGRRLRGHGQLRHRRRPRAPDQGVDPLRARRAWSSTSPPPGRTARPAPATTSGSLPFTGSRAPELLVTGLALLATGAAVLALARRTRTA